MLLLHVRFAREDAAKHGHALTIAELADTLRRLGYSVKIRTALGGGPGGSCLRSLRHSSLAISLAGPSGPMPYVLDPRFREQVGAAHARVGHPAGGWAAQLLVQLPVACQPGGAGHASNLGVPIVPVAMGKASAADGAYHCSRTQGRMRRMPPCDPQTMRCTSGAAQRLAPCAGPTWVLPATASCAV